MLENIIKNIKRMKGEDEDLFRIAQILKSSGKVLVKNKKMKVIPQERKRKKEKKKQQILSFRPGERERERERERKMLNGKIVLSHISVRLVMKESFISTLY